MTDLFSLAESIRKCTSCLLWKSRTLAVPGEGPSKAKLIFVGEAPGEEEDRQGLPFVGLSGKFLDSIFQQFGIDRKKVFITGAVKCHPSKNRTPKSTELKTCRDLWLMRQIELIRPEIIVILGKSALSSLLGNKNLEKSHGKVFIKSQNKFFVTYHPSAARRFPEIKKKMLSDFEKLSKLMDLKKL